MLPVAASILAGLIVLSLLFWAAAVRYIVCERAAWNATSGSTTTTTNAVPTLATHASCVAKLWPCLGQDVDRAARKDLLVLSVGIFLFYSGQVQLYARILPAHGTNHSSGEWSQWMTNPTVCSLGCVWSAVHTARAGDGMSQSWDPANCESCSILLMDEHTIFL